MAFICEGCIEPAAKDEFIYRPLSRGPCENCHYVDYCVDTRAGIDRYWRRNLKRALDKMREDGNV